MSGISLTYLNIFDKGGLTVFEKDYGKILLKIKTDKLIIALLTKDQAFNAQT